MHKLLVTTRIGRRADLVASGSSLGGRSQSRVGRAIFLSDFSSKVGLCEVSRLKAKRMLNFYGPSTTRARKNRTGKEGGGYIPMPVQWAHVTCSRHRQLFISGGQKHERNYSITRRKIAELLRHGLLVYLPNSSSQRRDSLLACLTRVCNIILFLPADPLAPFTSVLFPERTG